MALSRARVSSRRKNSAAWGEAVFEGLGLEGDAGAGQGADEVIDGGVGVVQPGEDEGLGEGGAGELALAADEPGVLGGLVGVAAEERLQLRGNLAKFNQHERLLE